MNVIRDQANTILSLLSDIEREKDIVEISNNSDNSEVINYLESIGHQEIEYDIESNIKSGFIQETGGKTYLWYKQPNGVWIIKLWEIKRFLR